MSYLYVQRLQLLSLRVCANQAITGCCREGPTLGLGRVPLYAARGYDPAAPPQTYPHSPDPLLSRLES
jgi:hypothetical protein